MDLQFIVEGEERTVLRGADWLQVVQKNRDRVRAVAGLIVTLDTVLISGSSVLLFSKGPEISTNGEWMILAAAILSMTSAITVLLAALIPKPVSAPGWPQLISVEVERFKQEQMLSLLSGTLLILAILSMGGMMVSEILL